MPLQESEAVPSLAPFTAEEKLFRGLLDSWVGADGSVLPEAIELPTCSFIRELVALTPAGAMALARPGDVALGEIAFANIPDRFSHTASPNVFDVVVVHCPEGGNDAHSEIRLRKVGVAGYQKNLGSKLFVAEMRDKIAARMSVAYRRPGF